MAVIDEQQDRVTNEQLGKLNQDTLHTRREWVTPTWERLETPMEVTMYAGRR